MVLKLIFLPYVIILVVWGDSVVAGHLYTNDFAVVIRGGPTVAMSVARDHGYTFLGQVSHCPLNHCSHGYYSIPKWQKDLK